MISRFAAHRRNATPPQRALVLLALLAYVVAGAIVPQGHMAAPISSGTPFHLCPGDSRSAQIIAALPMPAGEHHHRHHGHHDAGGVDKTAADPGCTFAGFGSAVADFQAGVLENRGVIAPAPARRSTPGTLSPAWLRPPARSPPA
ncbi:hypothetical protein E2F43_18335 [Seongchinamella unica]|uniref:DUF2946 domain-containing protein n=1 Tax=Seongchinamella unica TaxID=2547392 RepID=A0A4R5LMR6_9GAMM|nr:hypothetical protein [Seongchinamella unica]TDG11350.1 hypothetical protein E2F43_18335 [Seongchinamella unica]